MFLFGKKKKKKNTSSLLFVASTHQTSGKICAQEPNAKLNVKKKLRRIKPRIKTKIIILPHLLNKINDLHEPQQRLKII